MKKRKHFHHLDERKRDRLEILLSAGHKQKDIARVLGSDKSAISREISKRKRKNGVYDAETAQHKARIKRLYSKYQGMKVREDPLLEKTIIDGLKESRSPDEIAGRLKKKTGQVIGKDAIYKWLYSVFGQQYRRYLRSKRHRRKKQKRKTKREMIKDRISLLLRPEGNNYRRAEGDTIVSSKKPRLRLPSSLPAKYHRSFFPAERYLI